MGGTYVPATWDTCTYVCMYVCLHKDWGSNNSLYLVAYAAVLCSTSRFTFVPYSWSPLPSPLPPLATEFTRRHYNNGAQLLSHGTGSIILRTTLAYVTPASACVHHPSSHQIMACLPCLAPAIPRTGLSIPPDLHLLLQSI